MSTDALNERNHGSDNDGIFDASARSTIRIAVRLPFSAVKYAASGFNGSRLFFIFAWVDPSFTAALNVSTGNEAIIITRIANLLTPIGESSKHGLGRTLTLRPLTTTVNPSREGSPGGVRPKSNSLQVWVPHHREVSASIIGVPASSLVG